MNVRMDGWMDKMGRKFSSAPGSELVKLEPATESGCGSWRVSIFLSFVSTFLKTTKKKRLAQHLKTLYKLSLGIPPPFLSCNSEHYPASISQRGESYINTCDCLLDRDSSAESALINTFSKGLTRTEETQDTSLGF